MNSTNLQSLKLGSFLAAFRTESIAFWFLCFYILVEYLRPQSMYPILAFVPWGQVAILICLLGVFFTSSKALGFGTMDLLFVLFSLLVIASGVFAWDPTLSVNGWTTYASWMIMYFCIVSILTTSNRLVLFTLFFILINFKMSQHGARVFAMRGFSFSHWGLSGAPGWFHNSGELALQMVVMFSMSFAVLLAFREYVDSKLRWWFLILLFPATALLTVVGSSSRGGQLALAAVLLLLVVRLRHGLRNILLIGLLGYLGFHLLPEAQISRFETMGDDATSQYRLTHWENAIDTIRENPLGIGYKNWISYYAATYAPAKLEQIHNTVLEAFVDLGIPGGILFLVMFISSLVLNIKTRYQMEKIGGAEGRSLAAIALGINLGLVGTFVAALFMSVLYYPMFWLAFALTSSLRHVALEKLLDRSKARGGRGNGVNRYTGRPSE